MQAVCKLKESCHNCFIVTLSHVVINVDAVPVYIEYHCGVCVVTLTEISIFKNIRNNSIIPYL